MNNKLWVPLVSCAIVLPIVLTIAGALALAQSSPNWPTGYNPTAAEVSAAFASKLDATGGAFSGAVAATTLSASGATTLSGTFSAAGPNTFGGASTFTNAFSVTPSNQTVTLSPTGTGQVVINPATAGTMDNVVIGGVTPKAGHFTTISATTNSASGQKQVAAPTAPASTSVFAMQGLAGSITPATTGTVLLTISGVVANTSGTAGVGVQYQLSFGTGVAPNNAASLTGTQAGAVQDWINPAALTAADVAVPFSTTAVVTGLVVGTPYWLDLAAKSITTASAASLTNVSISAVEVR